MEVYDGPTTTAQKAGDLGGQRRFEKLTFWRTECVDYLMVAVQARRAPSECTKVSFVTIRGDIAMPQTLHARSEQLLKERIKLLKPNQHSFRFVFLGDSRGTGNDCFLSGEFKRVLKKAAARKPLFIVHGGDTVFSGTRTFLQHFVGVVKKFAPGIPLFCLVGNHDELFIGKSNLQNFRSTIGKVHWRINIPQFHFRCIALNNVINPGSPSMAPIYGFTIRELDYLKRQLQTSPRNTLLAMHVQPAAGRWSDKSFDGFPVTTPNNKRFLQLVTQHKAKIKRVLVSHVHAYDEQFIKQSSTLQIGRGTNYVLSGAAGAPPDINPILTYTKFSFTEFSVTKNRVSSPDLFRVSGRTQPIKCL